MLILIQIGFIALSTIYFAMLFNQMRKATNASPDLKNSKFLTWTITCVIIWAIFVSVWSISGIMKDFSMFPINFAPIIIVPLIAVLAFTFSRAGTEILSRIPISTIIQLNAFRVFVEVLLWALYEENQAPIQMTFEGRNFDILSGLSAPIVAYLFTKGKISKIGLVIWNVICLGLLINIVTVAILSTPTPFRVFMNDPVNTIVTIFPVSWLPGLLVPLAYGLHFFSLRQLAIKGLKP
jgi:hypothetical protein